MIARYDAAFPIRPVAYRALVLLRRPSTVVALRRPGGWVAVRLVALFQWNTSKCFDSTKR